LAEETATIPTVDIDVLTRKREAARLEGILFADYAVVGSDGKATVAGIFERVFVDPEKRETGRFFVYVKTVEATEAAIELTIIDPKGRVVATATGAVEPPALVDLPKPRRLTMIFPFGLTLGPEGVDGLYWFEVKYKGQFLGDAVLNLEFRKQGKE
jgi:hypothetical protein